MKQYIIDNWLLKRGRPSGKSLTDIQLNQAWARLGFATAGLLYVWLHGENFTQYGPAFLTASALYFLYNGLSIPYIHRQPLSAYRSIFSPVFDIFVVSFGILVDGGQASGIYFIYLVIIFGNGFRFGNALMLYTQTLSLIGLLITTAFIYNWTTMSIDFTLLCWQLLTLLVVPAYLYLIGQAAEKAIKAKSAAEQVSFNLLDKGPAPVFTFEPDASGQMTILYTNRATGQAFGHKHTMLVGEPVDTLILPEDRGEMTAFCQDTLLSEECVESATTNHIYIRGQDKEGNILKLTCTAIRMPWHNHWIGVCFILDITQRENLQEQLESVHRQGFMSTMVAGIVHDFRNVLNNMIGYAELLQMESKDKDTRNQLEAIIAAGDRGSDLITHLLKMSKRQKSDIQSTKTDGGALHAPLENIIGLCRLQMPSHIQLTSSIDNPLPDIAMSIIEVEQILLNLVNNAMQACKAEGQISIIISQDTGHQLASEQQGALTILVSDNGCGIASENIDNVFKAFWTSRSDAGGSGLGLAMVQRVVKRHHGCISVNSIADQKTTFCVHIPPFKEQGPAITTPTRPVAGPTTDKKATIPACHCLLVDDSPDILKIHAAMLARVGHSTDTAEDGQQALTLFQQQPDHFDLIITDYRMPIMNGLKLIQAIRALGSSVPILMITAYGEDHHLQEVSKYGAVLMNKPVTIEKLLNGMARALPPRS
ncbi:MAG: response regulator [Mariprofundus sp.]